MLVVPLVIGDQMATATEFAPVWRLAEQLWRAVVNVTTVYFGASADTVRGYITTQLERAIASADGKSIESLQRIGAKGADVGIVSTGDDITASIQCRLNRGRVCRFRRQPSGPEPGLGARQGRVGLGRGSQ